MIGTFRLASMLVVAGLLSGFLSACSGIKKSIEPFPVNQPVPAGEPVDYESNLPEILPQLAQYRVVLVGEQHDRLNHHVTQLDIIKYLHSVNPSLAIGLEMIQQPFQQVLTDYVEGRLDEQTMLEKTGYFSRWRYDYRLYAPILRFARDYRIPLVALNIPSEVTRQTAREGMVSLTGSDRDYIPEEFDRNLPGYEQRIRDSFDMHGEQSMGEVENFIDAQLLWDEGMALRAADFLQENPARQMVIIAGSGHIYHRTGIPQRLERRINSPVVTVLPVEGEEEEEAGAADFFVKTTEMNLPEKGLLGIMLEVDGRGVFASSFTENSAASLAGVKTDDYIRSINGRTINSNEDISLAMWDKKPGESVQLAVDRELEDVVDVLEFSIRLK